MDNNTTINTVDNETLGLKGIIVNYIRHWKLFLGVFLFSFIPALLYLILVPRTYEMMARIQVQQNDPTSTGSFGLGDAAGLMKSFGLGTGATSGTLSIDDEIAILTSNHLLSNVIYTLGMNVEYSKPGSMFHKLYNNSPLLLISDSTINNTILDKIQFKVSIDKNGKTNVNAYSKGSGKKYNFEFNSLPAIMVIDDGQFTLSYRNSLEPVKPYKMKISIKPASWIAEDIVEGLLIEELSKSSNVIELSYEDHERQRGVDLLNTLIKFYNEEDENIKRNLAAKSMTFMDERMRMVISDLRRTEEEIEKFKLQNNMTDIEYDVQFYIAQMQEIQVKLIEFKTQEQIINMMDDYVKDPANKYNLVPMLLTAQDGESGSAIAAYNTRLLERIQLQKSSKNESPLMNQMNDQVDHMRDVVNLSISNARIALNNSIAELKEKEKLLLERMGVVPILEREYIDYKRQQEISQGVYLLLLQKREDLALSMGELKSRSRIVDTAFIKEKSVGPRKLYAGLFMIILTIVVPIGYLAVKALVLDLKNIHKKMA